MLPGRPVLVLTSILLLAAGCGGGRRDRPLVVPATGFFLLEKFSAARATDVYLDEALCFVFSDTVAPSSIDHVSICIRTGPEGGRAPRGVFVRGRFLVDRETGCRVVIDPERIGAGLLREIEKTGRVGLIPPETRYDLGASSPLNGDRRLLFNHSRENVVMFVPAVPSVPDIRDTGYEPGATYTVRVPAYPEHSVLNRWHEALAPPREGEFVTKFTTVAGDAPRLFLGADAAGPPRVVNTQPVNLSTGARTDSSVFLRFSHPLDPRTVTVDAFRVDQLWPGKRLPVPVIPRLRQTRAGPVEVVLSPVRDLEEDATYLVRIADTVRDLAGLPLGQHEVAFSTGHSIRTVGVVESFDSDSMVDSAHTTADWNGVEPGALVASFASFAGSGRDGEFDPAVGETHELYSGKAYQREFRFTSIHVRSGARVVGTGDFPILMRGQGDAVIAGTIDTTGYGGTGLTIEVYGDIVVTGRIRAGGDIVLRCLGDIVLDPAARIGAEAVRLEDGDGTVGVPAGVVEASGTTVETFVPDLLRESEATSRWFNQLSPLVDYHDPVLDLEEHGGRVRIEVQGARENEDLAHMQPVDPEDDPGRAYSTDWVPIEELDRLDDFQYLRFRVSFRVAEDHAFGDPLPTVRELYVPVVDPRGHEGG